jgi:hypothetical protein
MRTNSDQTFLDPLVEEGEILVALLQQRLEDVLQQRFRQRRVIGQIREGDLRLDHPELGEVAAGVGVLGAKSRAERIDLGERQAVGLDIELARHGQEGFAAEKVLGEVDLAVRRARQIGEVEGRDAKQGPCPLGVGRGDDGRVDPEKSVVVEKAMDRLGERVAHPCRGADHIGARAQMGDLAQEFHAVRLGLDRIAVRIVDPADDLNGGRLHLERLSLGGRRHDHAGRCDGAAGGELLNLVGVVGQRIGRHHLDGMEA